jgi:DNA-binding transcriptional LysR family regulator
MSLNQMDLSRLDLNLLVLFEVVLAERNVARAAERLSLSASAVSHGLGRLRRMLGDPLFLRNPKGVVPTARAQALAEPVAEVLHGIRRLLGAPARFAPATSQRRFTIGAPDAVSAVLLPRLLRAVRDDAPGVDVAARNVLPPWQDALADLDARRLDVALLPQSEVPARFAVRGLFKEHFVVAMRRGHPIGRRPSLDRYCAAQHLLVSESGDPVGHVDALLAKLGRTRRVVLTVPGFLMALPVVAQTDVIAAMPANLVAAHAKRFDLVGAPLPVPLGRDRICAIVPQVALGDDGVAWFIGELERAARGVARG